MILSVISERERLAQSLPASHVSCEALRWSRCVSRGHNLAGLEQSPPVDRVFRLRPVRLQSPAFGRMLLVSRSADSHLVDEPLSLGEVNHDIHLRLRNNFPGRDGHAQRQYQQGRV